MTMERTAAEARHARARAEFYLCLAYAFRPPHAPAMHRAFTEDLSADLAALGRELELPVDATVEELRASLAALPEGLALLQHYSALFVTPPVPASLNAGLYLDGVVMGPSVAALERRYRDHGLMRADAFRDLPDHVSLQLEFVAFLFARAAAAGAAAEAARAETEARTFLADFVAHWLPALCADLERAVAGRGVTAAYLHLARVLRVAVEHDVAALPGEPRTADPGRLPASGPPTPEQIAEIARVLAAKGHSIDHLAIPLAARDAELGLTPLDPPTAGRGRFR